MDNVVKFVSQWQGQWTKWEGILPKPMGWSDLWRILQARLSVTPFHAQPIWHDGSAQNRTVPCAKQPRKIPTTS